MDQERGVIPMSTRAYEARPGRRWCRIGVAAGLARPSTGYAFLAIQRFTERLASRLAATRTPEQVTLPEVRAARTLFLDRVYLSYLARFPERAPEIMLQLFEAAPADVVVRFLSETGSVADDLRVMRAMPSALAVEAYRSRRMWLPR
jgi:lycopene beta-cyclase